MQACSLPSLLAGRPEDCTVAVTAVWTDMLYSNVYKRLYTRCGLL